ncbi:MAG: sigma-70 family RNA polymerase sigma factor [Chloroflexi bacterium]|nr:MAG: sigma-70 family RNA polymerase sigma factor [Chloroflexota bacterium]
MVRRTNAEWLEALQQPGEAQDEAYQALREYLRRAVFVYLRDRRPELSRLPLGDLHELAEDFAQDALISIQRSLNSFRGDARFTTWAYRFVINEAAAELRRRNYRNMSLDMLLEEGTAVIQSLASSPIPSDPSQAAARKQFIEQLLDIIDEDLNERQKTAVLGVHFQSLSMQEVAELLETSPNTVYKMLHDARKKIKVRLTALHLGKGDVLALFDDVW